MPDLYHIAHSNHVEDILAEGLKGVSYRDSSELVHMATHAMNDAIDQHAQTHCGPDYQPRVGSVFFWPTEAMARETAGDEATLIAVSDASDLRPLYCAASSDVQKLFSVFREGYVNGQQSYGSIYPAYDAKMVESTVDDFVKHAVSPWDGDSAGVEVWGTSHVPAEGLRVVRE